jgi:hypothetical protein
VEGGDDDLADIQRSPSVRTWVSVSEWDFKDRAVLDSASETLERTSFVNGVDATVSEATPRFPSIERQKPNLETVSHIPETIQDHHGFDTFLRSTTVQFLIDQEGFRDAEPSFKFCGISRIRSSGKNKPQDKVMTQFRPVSRQQFHFHHAPLETPPVLRRITVNNDDTSDYVSRQAHLTLKSNGVYVIHGHEALLADHGSEQTKLYWQFEYLVDDRRVDSSGSRRDMEGEKTFTPLTFSCSPRLLLPSQAKRINILHVFKKSLAPKLVAEKLQVRLGSHRSVNNPLPEKILPPKEPYYRNSVSHLPGTGDDAPARRPLNDHVLIGSRPEWQNTDDGHTNSLQQSQPLSRLPSLVAREHEHTTSMDINPPPVLRGLPAADRHIFPPARLSELLESSPQEGHHPAHHSVTPVNNSGGRLSLAHERDSKTLVALSPRPRGPASLKATWV